MSTIRDVANLAGVSTATVSRVINNDTQYKMTDETREKVNAAIKQLNYVVKTAAPAAAAPVKNRHKRRGKVKIACVLSVTRKKFNDPYYMSILSAIESRLAQRGYQINTIKTGSEINNPDILKGLFDEGYDAMILMENPDEDIFSQLRKNVPHIVGIDTSRRDIDNIDYDHYYAAELAVQHLIDMGYRKIGYVGGKGGNNNILNSRRYRGFYLAMLRNDIEVDDNFVVETNWDEDFCEETISNMARAGQLPEAFFCASDLMAMATLNALYKNGISVPGRVAVIGLTNLDVSKYSNPPLSTINVPMEEIGYVTADLLADRIEGDDLIHRTITLPVNLVVRSST